MQVRLSSRHRETMDLLQIMNIEIDLLEQGYAVTSGIDMRGITVYIDRPSEATWLALKYPELKVKVIDDAD